MAIIRDSDVSIYKINVGELPENELRVLRFKGIEGISQLFRFDFELVSRTTDLDFSQVVGKPAAFRIESPEAERYVNGMISRFEQGPVGRQFTRYYAQMVPKVWMLLHRIDSRIFQNKSVPGIIEEVLKEAGLSTDAYRLALQSNYKEREYCVQYQESDWAFISRLMEDEGIFYFFEHKEDDHVLVLGDSPSANTPIAEEATVPARFAKDLEPDKEYVGTFQYVEGVRIGAVQLRDFDFKSPKANLDAKDKASDWKELELFEYPGDYHSADVGKQRATARLEERQSLRVVATGEAVIPRLTPGYRFTLEGHYRAEFDREYLLTDLRHEGHEPQALEEDAPDAGEGAEYVNQFRAIPSDVPYRPPRITPHPFIRGTQTATVVGPSGEEIYTDEYGRVKVRFHWDRRGEVDENSSCWTRVSQQWAGGGWGFMWIPRVAQEVVIAFHEGNPDQPHIIGRVYNADQMPPYELPTNKTKSTIKTASSKGAEGFNEIRFEDKKGEEQIFIHGEKDLDLRIKNNRVEWVGNDAHLIVKKDQVEQIENEHHTKVKADDVTEIGKDRHLKVTGKEAVEIGGSHSLTVKGDVIEVFKANHSEQVTQNYYLKGMGIVIESMQGITLKCGGSSVVVDQTGVTLKGSATVTIDGPMVKIASGPGSPPATGSTGSAVSPIAPNEPNEADLADPGKMDQLKAEQQKAGQGRYGATQVAPFQREDDDGEEKTWIEIELVDEEGNPVPGERYEVTLPDGQTVARGTLDENGLARIEGLDPGECKVTFPALDRDAWEPQ